MIEIIPNWHPIWVHFAIALLITSAGIFLLFGWRTGQANRPSDALIVARWTLWLGVIAAAGALLTGYWASGSVAHDDVGHANMLVHRNWALIAAAIFALAAILEYVKRRAARASIFSILLVAAGGATLAVTGLEGAENVYEHGLGVQRLPQLSAHEHLGDDHTAMPEQGMETGDAHESGEAHSHADAEIPSMTTPEGSVANTDHPASLAAASLHDAIVKGDVETFQSLVAPDVLIFESGGVEASLAEYEGHHMSADMAFMKSMEQEVLSRQVFDAGDSAIVVTRSRVHGVYEGKDVDLSSTETLVMKQAGGQWQIVHIHWSSS